MNMICYQLLYDHVLMNINDMNTPVKKFMRPCVVE